ncbi:MAG: hypothetical protein ACRC5C_02915, partial [Bacilli bacterium]
LFVTEKGAVFELATEALVQYSISFLILGANLFIVVFYTSIGDARTSGWLASVRSFIVMIPVIVILGVVNDAAWIWYSLLLTESLVCIYSFVRYSPFRMKWRVNSEMMHS